MKTSLLGLAVLWASPALATTYYVSPAGSDANACSQASPCRQIRRPLRLVAPGDTILVADGTYLGFDVRVRGTAAAPVVIKAVGTGAVVVKTTDRRDNRDTIFVTSSSHVVIDGLRSFGANRAAVRVDASPRITVRNGVFGDNGTWGIFTNHSDDLLIENNECYGSLREHGIYVSNSGDRPVVRGNRVHHNRASGIQLNADLSAGGDGIISGALLEGNVAWANGTSGGAALNLDGVQDSTVRNNLLYDNHATGIVNYRGDGAQGPRGMQILHNTIDQAADGRWAVLIHDTTGPMVLRNNVLHHRHSFRGSIEYGTPSDAERTDSDYNVMGRVSLDAGDSVITLAQWQSLGHETHSRTATLASLFVNPAAGDYHLAAGSPALDRGLTLPQVTTDLEGRPRPAGAASDIGAYEGAGAPPGPAVMLTPAPGARLPGSTVTFTWSAGTGVTQYWLYIGTQRGAANLYAASQGTRRTVTVSGLPTDGRTLWVRLFSRIDGVWHWTDVTYTAAGP